MNARTSKHPSCFSKGLLLLACLFFASHALGAEHTAFIDFGIEQQKHSWFLLIEPGLSIKTHPFELRLAAPLRFDVEDSFHLWEKDWDTLSDAGRVLRKAALQLNDGALRLTLGFLAHTSFGHGTLVQGFVSSLDPDVMPLGANARIQAGPLAFEAMISDVFAPEMLGGNVILEPTSLFGFMSDRLHLIGSIVADPNAPGAWREDGTQEDSSWVILYGFGMDWTIVRAEHWQLATYFDTNFNGRGHGFHAGFLADVLFTALKLSFKGEWRWAKAPYAPDYFDLAYTIERRDYGSSTERPIAQALALEAQDPGHSGKVELRLESGPLSATAVLAGMGRDVFNASIVVNAVTGNFDISLFGALRHFNFGSNPDRALGMAEARYRFLDYFYVWLTAGQLYRINDEGRAAPIFMWSTGVGAAFLLQKPPNDIQR